MLKAYTFVTTRLQRALRNQRGAQAIEYVGIAALVVVLISALASLFKGTGDDSIAGSIVKKLKEFIGNL